MALQVDSRFCSEGPSVSTIERTGLAQGNTLLTSYVLVTPAKNEAATIPLTIKSVLAQTILPREWVIVSDGSTDDTNRIVKEASAEFPWIRLLELPQRPERNFGAVVKASEAGIAALQSTTFEYIGLLDSDVQFQPDYFQRVIETFERAPKLGLAGGVVIDVGLPKDQLPRNLLDVPGAVQFFRRECFQALGGLIAVPEGGWDGLTCAKARMQGFQTRLIPELIVDHLKPRNISEGGQIRRKWQMGVRDYAFGAHPIFELIKCIGRVFEPPILLGSAAWWVGYCSAMLQRRKRHVPSELVHFIRSEQKNRLLKIFRLHGIFSSRQK
jgi:glycosyltransferase involved in cell wall biosynthesis